MSANQDGEIDEGSFEIQFTLVSKEETLPEAIFVPFVAQIAAGRIYKQSKTRTRV